MARITIKDLPKDQKISIEEMKRVLGGSNPYGPPSYPRPPYHFDNSKLVSVGWGGSGFRRVIRPVLYEFPAGSIPPPHWEDI